MIINGYPCAYQDYGKRIIVFSNASRSHFIIQDIYAEFFRLCILQNNSKEFVIKYHRNTEWQNLLSAKTLIALPLLLLVHVPLLCRVQILLLRN